MGEDKKSGSSLKNPNAVFVALGVVAMVILAALLAVWPHVGYHRPATLAQSQSDQVSSQSPSGRGSVSENQQSGVSPVKPVKPGDADKPGESPDPQVPEDSDHPVPPVSDPVPVDGAHGSIYIVQPGDTLSSISASTGVSVDKLVQANSIEDVNRIYRKSALVIP